MHMLDAGEGNAFVAGRLERVNHPTAALAASVLRQGQRYRALGVPVQVSAIARATALRRRR